MGALVRHASTSIPCVVNRARPLLSCGSAEMTERTDEELLAAWREGSDAAGTQLCERIIDPLYRFFRNKTDGAPEDLVQQTLAATVEGRARFEGRASFRSYVFGIARNVLRSALRSRYEHPHDPDFSTQSLADLVPSPSSIAAHRQQNSMLHQALRKLPVDQQIALELFYWEGLTGPEIAEILGLKEGGVRSRLLRGRAALREQMEQMGAPSAQIDTSMSELDRDGTPPPS